MGLVGFGGARAISGAVIVPTRLPPEAADAPRLYPPRRSPLAHSGGRGSEPGTAPIPLDALYPLLSFTKLIQPPPRAQPSPHKAVAIEPGTVLRLVEVAPHQRCAGSERG